MHKIQSVSKFQYPTGVCKVQLHSVHARRQRVLTCEHATLVRCSFGATMCLCGDILPSGFSSDSKRKTLATSYCTRSVTCRSWTRDDNEKEHACMLGWKGDEAFDWHLVVLQFGCDFEILIKIGLDQIFIV